MLCPGMTASNLSASSARSRPARFGGPGPPPPEAALPPQIAALMLDPEEVARAVIRGVRENRLHIFSHVDARPMVERRFAQIAADFDAEASATGAGST